MDFKYFWVCIAIDWRRHGPAVMKQTLRWRRGLLSAAQLSESMEGDAVNCKNPGNLEIDGKARLLSSQNPEWVIDVTWWQTLQTILQRLETHSFPYGHFDNRAETRCFNIQRERQKRELGVYITCKNWVQASWEALCLLGCSVSGLFCTFCYELILHNIDLMESFTPGRFMI